MLLTTSLLWAQSQAGTSTVLILPFENDSRHAGLEWIGEAFPEVVGQRLAAQSMFVISREDRQYAFDRMGIPENLHASRATLYRIGSQLDADYLLFGSYSYDGQTFTARAQVLDMKALRLSPDLTERGPLKSLIAIQTALAWDVSLYLYPDLSESRESFVQRAPAIRLDAFENFIRGVASGAQSERIRYLKAALAINSGYAPAILMLGKTFYTAHDCEQASQWFAKMPRDNEDAGESNFYLGLCDYQLGRFEKASEAFRTTAERVPLTEVMNNLGAAESRRGQPDALEYFHKAVETDPSDPDYHFNYALALARKGDLSAAQHQLREGLGRNPNDAEADRLLQAIAATHSLPAAMPLPRIKRNYDESGYRQLAVSLQNAIEASVDRADPAERATLHVQRAREFLAAGNSGEAVSQFREALIHEPSDPNALSGIARAFLLQKKFVEARYQALAALRVKPSAEAYLVLARVDLHDNDLPAAELDVRNALVLEPNSREAHAVSLEIADRETQPVSGAPMP
jgi:tetratricopeptide (TPR) repeat protein